MQWSERTIGRAIFEQAFTRKHVVLLPNTYYTGYEADVLLVRADLRLVDIEIKVSRSDFKADQHKDKWWKYGPHEPTGESNKYGYPVTRSTKTRREWPIRVWKHYYALPREIWKDGLEAEISPKSGILLFTQGEDIGDRPVVHMSVHRQAKPRKDAKPIDAGEAIEVAKLCNARMWAAYASVERMVADRRAILDHGDRNAVDEHPEGATQAGREDTR